MLPSNFTNSVDMLLHKLFFIITICGIPALGFSQNDSSKIAPVPHPGGADFIPEYDVYYSVDSLPVPLNLDEVVKKLIYPKKALSNGIEGTVVIRGLVTPDGKIINPKIVKSPDESLSNEALRLLKKARFKPAMVNQVPVFIWINIPFKFKGIP